MSGGWNTIESDAGVFTFLLQNLGAKDVQFEELVTLEEQELRQLTPLYGIIFLFKYVAPDSTASSDKPPDGTFDHTAEQRLFFAKQTIQNACGTQALLSVLLNKDDAVDIGPQLRDFKDFTSAFPSELRGEALSNSDLIRNTHNSFARSSPFVDETARQATDDDDLYHFIAYTPIAGRLYELDGLQPAPIDHGPCGDDFPAAVIPVIQRRIARYPVTEIRFNLIAMTCDLLKRAREIGDQDAVEREERKRDGWKWENALRRHNFVGFVGELVKGVAATKVGETGGEGFDKWVQEAVEKTAAQDKERRTAAGAAAES